MSHHRLRQEPRRFGVHRLLQIEVDVAVAHMAEGVDAHARPAQTNLEHEAGVGRDSYLRRFNADYYDVFRKEIDSAVRDGLLEWWGNAELIRLTERGRLLGNRVFRLFV